MTDFEDPQVPPLPFSVAKQDALLGHLLFDEKFFLQGRDLITPELLVDPWAAKTWSHALSFNSRWNRPPSEAELRESSDVMSEEQGARNKVYAKIAQAKDAMRRYGLDVLRTELDSWIHGAIYRRGVEESAKLFHKGKFKDAFQRMRDASRSIDNISFTETAEVDFSSGLAFLEHQRLESAKALTFGVTAMDRLLLPSNKTGSLLPGDQTILLAPTNIGKSSAMITIARHNILRGKSVLYFTHEGRSSDLQEKIWKSVLNVNTQQLYDMQTTEDGRRRLANAQAYLSRFLTYIPIHRPSLTVEELDGIIRRCFDKRMAKYGTGYDLVVDDYPAKLTTIQASQGNMQRRQKDEHVYDYMNRQASEMGYHNLVAIQGNREASRINRREKGHEERLLTPEDVAESFGAMMVGTNVISINRDPSAVANHRLTYFIGKSRSSETGWAVVCRTNYSHCMTHSDDMGATWYRGTSPLSEQVDNLLTQYKGQALPEAHWGFAS
jgi:hypothetical protein